MKDENTFIT